MHKLTIREIQLPETIEDLSRFLLIAPEKARALRAEIQAIKNLRLASEVYEQKMEEARRLSELILDAKARMGDFTKEIPKASGGDRKSEKIKSDNNVVFEIGGEEKIKNPNGGKFEKSKEAAIRDLGFTHTQVHRFETLADNRDVVEEVKAEARETRTIPTQERVFEKIKERKAMVIPPDDEFNRRMNREYAISDRIGKTVDDAVQLDVDPEHMRIFYDRRRRTTRHEMMLSEIDLALNNLNTLRNFVADQSNLRRMK